MCDELSAINHIESDSVNHNSRIVGCWDLAPSSSEGSPGMRLGGSFMGELDAGAFLPSDKTGSRCTRSHCPATIVVVSRPVPGTFLRRRAGQGHPGGWRNSFGAATYYMSPARSPYFPPKSDCVGFTFSDPRQTLCRIGNAICVAGPSALDREGKRFCVGGTSARH